MEQGDVLYSASGRSPPATGETYTVLMVWLYCPDCKRKLGKASRGAKVDLKCRHCSKKAKTEIVWSFDI